MHYTTPSVDMDAEQRALTDESRQIEHQRPSSEGRLFPVDSRSATYRVIHCDETTCGTEFTSTYARESTGDFHWIVISATDRCDVRWSDREERRCADDTPTGTAQNTLILTSGQAMVMDSVPVGRPCPGTSALMMRIPYAKLGHAVPSTSTVPTRFGIESGLGRVIASMVRTIHAESAHLDEFVFTAVCDRISQLICLLLADNSDLRNRRRTEIVETVRRYVRETVGTGDVRLPAVAHALGWSERQVRLALHHSGTTYRHLRREEALRTARAMLEHPSPPIAEVAVRCGFTVTWFSAAFKNHYGETPRDFRKRQCTGTRPRPSRTATDAAS